VKVTDVRCHVLLDPAYDAAATSSAQDDIVVEIETDEGLVGIGETDLNAWVARACIEAPGTHTMDLGLRDLLIGSDPLDPDATWERLYVGTAMTGRRGAGVHALGALDVALWDLRGKAAGRPSWQLLGDPVRRSVPAYASLLPEETDPDDFQQALVDQARWAQQRGFRAAKVELLYTGPYASSGLDEPEQRMTETLAAVRGLVGPDFTLMADVGYAWSTAGDALAVVEAWAEYDVFFVETPLWADDLDGYAELVRRSPVPVAAGEWLATRHEFVELMDRGRVQVVQPDVGRVGGLTEARRVTALARERSRIVVPHGWKTGITIAATAALGAVTAEMPFMEFLPRDVAESALRRELLDAELELVDGEVQLSDRPGLGVELDRAALERFAAAAESRHPVRG
jgi:L-alanine-DL-glutamate epimerase-like enolase superfamily enzyme